MAPPDSLPPEVVEFIHRHLPSVEQLEVLLLLRRAHPEPRTVEAIDHEIGSSAASIRSRCEDLARRGFLSAGPDGAWAYVAEPARDAAVDAVARAYRDRRVSVITAIASRPNDLLRTFADAFRIRRPDQDKDQER
jgi:hypothetical protein